ncbi:putative MFS family arabinose efflux permease [Kribbella pratensis]|uniref:MFS family arabinose efflux permease n=1 Tax=Kribbella pratensis TaxID=2512112 RepID=A0ABY2FB43_9ACTN|nr:MFS transporter [Kribbella pratensis]TDW87687.1 putative MFS family arabinose efflux permease [Kribbella pratensis]
MQPKLLAVAAGVAVATVYFAQPLLVTMGSDLGIAPGTVGVVVTVTQVGYGLGLFFLVPLGDLLDRRRLVQVQFLLLAVALLTTALARNAAMLMIGLGAVGALAVVAQSLVVLGAALSDPAERGRTVGTITTGIVLGILLARTASGVLTDLLGWRAVYLIACAASLAITMFFVRSAPQPRVRLTYGELLRSTVDLWRERLFRESAIRAFFIFASFSTLWSSIALPLSERSLSHTEIGAFGLIGAAGALAAGPAGRLADRGYGRVVTTAASVLLATSWAVTAWTPRSLVALAIGTILLDLTVQAVHVTNQSRIYPLRPEAGGRIIGGYMIFYSLGSGTGAIASTMLYEHAGWTGVCLLGTAFGLGSVLTTLSRAPRGVTGPGVRRTSRASRPCGSCR